MTLTASYKCWAWGSSVKNGCTKTKMKDQEPITHQYIMITPAFMAFFGRVCFRVKIFSLQLVKLLPSPWYFLLYFFLIWKKIMVLLYASFGIFFWNKIFLLIYKIKPTHPLIGWMKKVLKCFSLSKVLATFGFDFSQICFYHCYFLESKCKYVHWYMETYQERISYLYYLKNKSTLQFLYAGM